MTSEQRQHIEACWKAADLRWAARKSDEQRLRVGTAQLKHNTGAVLNAYQEAALDAMRDRARTHLEVALRELQAIGIVVDESVEQFVVSHVRTLTSICAPLHFPPRLARMHQATISAIQGSYVLARMRLKNELDLETQNLMRSTRLRDQASSAATHVSGVVNNYTVTGPNARLNVQSIDNSINKVEQ